MLLAKTNAGQYTIKLSGGMSRANLGATGSGAQIMTNAVWPGLDFDTKLGKLVGWAGGADVYTLDLSVSPPVWTTITPAASNKVTPTAPAKNGTYGRWRYVPSKDEFILVNAVDQNVFFYRLRVP